MQFQGKEKFEKAVQDVEGNMLSGQASSSTALKMGLLML
jgi:hypothetical protein